MKHISRVRTESGGVYRFNADFTKVMREGTDVLPGDGEWLELIEGTPIEVGWRMFLSIKLPDGSVKTRVTSRVLETWI